MATAIYEGFEFIYMDIRSSNQQPSVTTTELRIDSTLTRVVENASCQCVARRRLMSCTYGATPASNPTNRHFSLALTYQAKDRRFGDNYIADIIKAKTSHV